MATERDNVKIEIIIAGEPILLTAPFSKQNDVRACESDINALFADWRAKFPRKTTTELLAMIAYQYASFYRELSERYASLSEKIEETSSALDALLENAPEIP